MTPDDKIYGHPEQVQPAHMVITSPYYDYRENCRENISSKRDLGRDQHRWDPEMAAEIVRLRAIGMSFQKIANRLELPHSTVFDWNKRASGE